MVPGESHGKEFIMTKLNNVKLNQVKGNGKSAKAKVERNTVALVAEKGLVLCTNGQDINDLYQNDSSVAGLLEALTDLLESIPDNKEEIIEKPYRVLLPGLISGLATGSIIDWIRTGKKITSGEALDQATLESYCKVMLLVSAKYVNVELVADNHRNADDRKVADNAWKTLKAEIAKVVRGASVVNSASAPAVSAEDQARIAELKAKLAKAEDELLDADDEEVEAKLEKKIAKLQSMIARTIANSGQSEDTQDTTDLANAKSIEDLM